MSEKYEKKFNIYYVIWIAIIMAPGLVALLMILTNGTMKWVIFAITELCTYLMLRLSYILYDEIREANRDTL